ncbi:tenascin-X, partial [Lingula anatina]|uniref:Tenascin-X n=1 Tax=Lingula anatina TaxID=7574 RepID=A0A1S3IA73_LINAN
MTRMMSRPLKEMLEGVVFDPDEIRIHHETIEDDDTVTVNLEWNGPLKGEYSGFRITVEKRTDGNFVFDNTVHVVKAEVGKEREKTACLRRLERGSVYKVRVFSVLEKEEGVIRTSQPSKIVIATKPPEPRSFVLKQSSGRFARSDRRLTLTGMVDKGNVTSFVLQYSVYSTHASTSGTHSKTTTKSRAIPDVITGKETDIQVRDLLPGTLYRFMLKCRCDYSKMETEERPINMDASHNESDFVEITVLTNPGEVKKVELQKERLPKLDTPTSVPIRWVKPKGSVDRYTVFYRGSQDEVFRQVPSHKESCILYGLTPGTEYTVIVAAECCTDNEFCEYPPAEGVQESAESNYIQGKKVQADITLYTHPAKPTEMAAASTCTSIDVTWAKPSGQVQSYLVSWSDSSGDTGLKEVPCDTCTYTINYLQPGTKYTLSVQAKSNGIHSEKETMSKVTVPDSAVDVNISEIVDDTTKVRVTWGRLQGRVDSYSVICMDQERYRREIRIGTSQDDHSVELQGLVPGRYYEVCITAFSWDVQGRREDFQFSTKPNPPKRLRLDDEPGMDRSAFEWEPPVGDVEEYVLKINQKDSDHCLGDHVTTATRFSVNDLSPGTIYVCSVTSYSQGKESVPSCITFVTAPAPPEDIQLELRDDTDVFVTWRSPSVGLYDGYTARCYSCETGDTIMEVKSNLEKAEFCELFPGTKYKFSVESCSNGRFSLPAEKHYLIRPGKPVVLKKEKFDTKTIFLQWRPPHGKVNQYIVKYSGNGDEYQETMITTEDTGITLCNLNPGTRYSGDIIARVLDDGRHFDGLVEQWTAVTDPSGIGDCDVMHLTLKSVQLSWRRPDGQVNHFRVSYWPRGKAYRLKNVEIRETCKVLTDLDPGTRYEAQITSVSNGRESDSYQMQFDTGPDVALDFAEAGRGSTHVDLKWNIPRGSFEFFIVRWRSEDEAGVYESTKTPKTHHTVNGLCPGDRYEVGVVTVSNEMESEPCFIYVQTDPAPIADIDIEPGIDAIKCKWSKPKGKVDGYRLQLKGPKDLQTGKTLPPIEVEEVEIPGLTPGTTYLGCLFTVRNDQRSEPYCFSCSTRPAECTPECSDKGTRSLKITWKPAEGEIRYYEIQLIRDHESVRTKKIPRDNDTEAIFDDLLPGTKYEVIIRTVTDNAYTTSDPLDVYTDPDEVGKIEIQAQERSATLSWVPPFGNWESFRVSHWKYKKEDKINKYTDECVFSLVELEPGKKNYVEIATLVNGIESKERTETFVAIPDMVDKGKIGVTEGVKTFTLKWDRPVGKVDGYKISVKQEDNESYQRNIESLKPNVVINKIVPGMGYRIEIRCYSFEKESKPCCIPLQKAPDPPSLPKAGVTVTKNTITLCWDVPEGKFERYQIFCKKDGTDTGTCSDLSTGKTYVLTDLQPSTHYTGWIRTLFKGKLKSEHVNFDCFTDPEPPQHFSCLKHLRETTTLTLEWEASRGDIKGYTLIIRDTDGNETPHKLGPKTIGHKHILVIDARCISLDPSTPTDFKQTWSQMNKRRHPTSVKLKWDMPTEIIAHFEIIYDAHGVGRNPVKVEQSRRTAEIYGLEPGTEYNCTPARPGTIVPGSIVASTKGLYLQWMPAEGAVNKYIIMYRSVQVSVTDNQDEGNAETQIKQLLQGSDSDVQASEKNLDINEEKARDARYEQTESVQSKCNLEKLDPGTNYEIRIFAITHSYPSLPQQLTQATKPGKPGEVKKEETTTNESISLSWGASEGNVSRYEIEYGRKDRTTRQPLSSNAPNCIIDNISPGVPYSYKVYAISNGMRSDPSQFVAATDLPCPENFREIQSETTARSIHLQWDAPPSITTGSWSYTVRYRSFETSEEFQNDTEVTAESLKVTGLVPGRKYEFSLQVTGWKDAVGHSTSREVFCIGATDPEPVHGLKWDTSTNTLTWDKPDGDTAKYDVTVTMGQDITTFHTMTCKYNLHPIVKGETYVFSVVAVSNEKASKEVSKTVTIAPGNPEFVKEKTVVTTSSITLYWTPPDGKVKRYTLYHQSEDEDNGFLARFRSRGENSVMVEGCFKTLENLQPGFKYHFRVCAEVDGAKDEAGDTIIVATEPERPSIECDLSSKYLALHCTCKGRKDCYDVRYKYREDQMYQTKKITSDNKISTERLVLLEWQPGRVYDVEVNSISYFSTNLEARSEPVKMTIHTVPSKPTVSYEASATDLTVKWVKVDEPGVDKITIKYWVKGDNTKTTQLPDITDVSATTASIHNLRPGTSYRAEVTFHCGDKSSTRGPFDITTGLLPPATVFHTSVSTSTANIEWDEPNGQCDHMVVTLTNLTTNETHEKIKKELSAKYNYLRPATCYRVSVMTVKGTRKSAVTSHTFNTAPLPPTGISVNPGSNTANISWTYPGKLENSGISFEISYWEINARRSEPFPTVSSKTLQTTIKSLTPGSQYKVQVKAVFQGTESDDFQETTFSTEPAGVTDVQVQGFSTYADVSWRHPVHGNVKSYDIVCWPANNPSAKRKTTVQYPAVTGSIIDLKQGTKYVMEVKSSVEGRESQGGERKAFYTVPSQPSMGSIDTGPDSIRLKWSRKEDEPDVTDAVVTYCLPDSTQKITKHVSTTEPQQLLISPLNPNTHIKGYVELVCGDKTSDKKHWSATTDPIKTGKIHVGCISETTANLSWADNGTAGTVEYRVDYKEKSPWAKWLTKGTDVPNLKLTDLEPGTEYMVAVSTVIDGADSEARTTTEFTTRPGQPDAVKLVGSPAAESAPISWKPPAGVVDHYRLEYKTDKGEPVTKMIRGTESSYELANLIPGTNYTIALCCVRHKKETLDVPIITAQPDSTAILLSWSQYKGNAESFEITCQSQHDEDEKQSV